jgi:hypothetical protein
MRSTPSANAWSMLRHGSRARSAAGAMTLGVLVLPVTFAGLQIAPASHFLWRDLVAGR